jgi:hypothetical protein
MSEALAFGLFIAVATVVILGAIALAVALTVGFGPRKHRMDVEHSIAVSRSGRPEMTDPMPSPARVRRPVSEAYRRQERTLSEDE